MNKDPKLLKYQVTSVCAPNKNAQYEKLCMLLVGNQKDIQSNWVNEFKIKVVGGNNEVLFVLNILDSLGKVRSQRDSDEKTRP